MRGSCSFVLLAHRLSGICRLAQLCHGAHDLPVHYLRLLATPVQLLSAAMWHTVQGGLVDRFGVLEEFVSMTTELVPELMNYSQRSQLILGLRARLVLEMCRGDDPVDFEVIQPHLDRMKAPASGTKDHQLTVDQVEESEVNFVELVHSILDDPAEKKFFFEEVFPMYFGSKFDAALEMLMWEFISRLDELLPLPDFTQLAALLGDAPAFLDDCLTSFFPPEDMKAVLQHHRQLGHFQEKDPRLLPMDNCILTSMSLSPAARRAGTSAPPISAHKDPPDHIIISESSRLRPGSLKADETIDLTLGSAVPDSDDESCIIRGWVQRKRKLSQGEDLPPKLMKSHLDEQYSAVSPLISIWGDYTAEGPAPHSLLRTATDDSQEDSGLAQIDSKVPWSDEETMTLLDIWGQDSTQRALKRCLKNRHIFAQIAQKMAEHGYARSTEQCQTRIKRLKKCFRRNVRGNSGNEYKFYEQLQRVLGSSRPPDHLEVSYDVDEIVEEEESRDADEELQFVGQATALETVSGVRVPWTDLETLTLINTWGDDRMNKRSGAPRTGNIFAIISSKMASQGFSRTPEQCQTRLKRLRSKFRQCYENNIRGRRQVHCRFYNQLGRVLVKDFEPDPSLSDDPEPEDSQPEPGPSSGASSSAQDERRKVPWSDRETVILLEVWGDAQEKQSSGRTSSNVLLFTEIADKLAESGFSRTAEQCQTRVKRLKSTYWQCRDSPSNGKIDFRFYELMEQILDKQPSTSAAASSAVTDSIEISEESADEEDSNAAESAVSAEKTPQNSWTDEETLGLISVWGDPEIQEAFAAPVANRLVHANIAERMKELGYSRTGEQCRWKMKALRNNYRNSYERKLSGKVVDYRFYDLLEKILGPRVENEEGDDALEQIPVCADPANLPWTEVETMTLVQVWAADDVQLSLKMSVRNGHVYADIADKMAALGYTRTAEQCQNRIKRLKKTYRRHCNSRRNGARAAFQYFHLMDPVLNGSSAEDVSTSWSLPAEKENKVSTSQPTPDSAKKTPWSEQETRTLLQVWGDDGVQLTLRGCQKNRHVFNYISDRMSDSGYSRTPDQCYTRIKRLKHGFLHEKEEFKFFVEMEEIFSRDLSVDESVAEEPDEVPAEQESEAVPAEVQWTSDTTKHPWGDPETRVLLEIWGSEDMQESLRSCTKNKHVFVLISEAMVGRGYPRTPEQCQTRIKRLRANFRHFLDGRKGENECKFFQQLSHIFGDKYGSLDTSPDDPDDQEEPVDCVS
ncbi:uncharacterized protein zgc:113263 isoform X3 [Synchiropus splendidus]|uniref:uncharacterized protein zgc:113263 isoform X3 n=1 Tax=Synchiropus splendidus TaxID=270530 RepID=UPI00237D75AF|nr:uncharacterized protein zgc:113263 isoform X3 [Synchiropus splendidus]